MPVTNEILPFAPQATVALSEILSLADYTADGQRLRGNQPGIARLELVNTVLKQTSHMAAGLAQFIAKRYDGGVKDDGDLDAVESGLQNAISALVLSKVDGKTTQADAGGVITVKDVAIGGNFGDLASARGQVGELKVATTTEYQSILNIRKSCRLYFNGTEWGKVADRPFEAGYGAVVIADVSSDALRGEIWAFSLSDNDAWKAQFNEKGTSPFARFIMSNAIGDGIRVTNGIISVPEYKGATASAAGTSGLVPPAAASQRESFLTGGGEYKPALSTGGGIVTGSIQINDPANVIGSAPSANTERGLFLGDKNSVIMGGFDIIQHASDNAKRTQMFAKNASGVIASIAAVTHEDGTREISTDCPMRLSDVQIERLFADSVRLIKFSGAHGNEGLSMRYSPDNGELYLDGRAVHGKADTAVYADNAGTLGGKAESALSVSFASEAQNAFGLKGMDMIIVKTTHTLPNYGTWKYMYLVATDEKWIDMVIGESPGGTTLAPNYPAYPGAFMDGMAFRSA